MNELQFQMIDPSQTPGMYIYSRGGMISLTALGPIIGNVPFVGVLETEKGARLWIMTETTSLPSRGGYIPCSHHNRLVRLDLGSSMEQYEIPGFTFAYDG